MKTLLFTSVLFFFVPAAFALPGAFWENSASAPQFCFQNFNAYGPLYAGHREERTQGILGHLKAVPKCDIVQLQEVWMESQISQIENSLQGHYDFYDPNRDHRIGIMSLVMGDILNHEVQSYAVNDSGSVLDKFRGIAHVQKAFSVIRVKLPAMDEELYVMNTHLHPSSQAVRLTQLLDLLRWRHQHQDLKLFISGDFNADINSLERTLLLTSLGLHDAMAESFPGHQYPQEFCTYCASNPLSWLPDNHTFDYIFYSNRGSARTHLKVESGEVNLRGSAKKPLSDHFGIRVQFSVQENAADERLDADQIAIAVKTLGQVIEVFQAQKSAQFKPYVNLARQLIAEIEKSESQERKALVTF